MKVCYCTVMSSWTGSSVTPALHNPHREVPVERYCWQWKDALGELRMQSVFTGESSGSEMGRSWAAMEKTGGQHRALCSHRSYSVWILRQSSKFYLAFSNHSTQVGGEIVTAECVPTHSNHPGFPRAVCDQGSVKHHWLLLT